MQGAGYHLHTRPVRVVFLPGMCSEISYASWLGIQVRHLGPAPAGTLLAGGMKVYALIMPTRRKAGEIVKTSLVLPEPLWRRMKLYGLEHEMELREIIIAAVESYLPKRRKGPQ